MIMHIHFIGSNGASMRVLKRLAENAGNTVSGSDRALSGHKKENVVGADLIVYTNAVSDDNVELKHARILGIETIERAEFLGVVMANFECVISVAGTHGKTSACAYLAEIFAHRRPCLHIGGTVIGARFENYKPHFAINEACEYKRSFLLTKSKIALVLNIERDHPDYYKDDSDYISAFHEYANL